MQNQLSIIVPGIGGSKIYCNCNINNGQRLYPRKYWFFNSAIDEHMYTCKKITTKPMKTFWTLSIYDNFLKKLKTCNFNRVHIFSYDWRRDPNILAKDLLEFIIKCKPNNYTQMKIYGHSLGGLLIRIMLEYHNGLSSMNIDSDQMIVYQCGTPMYGSLDIRDYNYGFELASLLASAGLLYSSCPASSTTIDYKSINRLKPFLFSEEDLQNIMKTSSQSLFYLLPTPIIKTIYSLLKTKQLNLKEYANFDTVYNVHLQLSRLLFPVKYNFFYNIAFRKIEKIYIPFYTNSIFQKLSIHEICPKRYQKNNKKSCGIHVHRLLKSDGLVVPFCGNMIPANCSIYVDESEKCKHVFLMNSKELWRLAKNDDNRKYISSHNFNNLNDDSEDDILPIYNELFTL